MTRRRVEPICKSRPAADRTGGRNARHAHARDTPVHRLIAWVSGKSTLLRTKTPPAAPACHQSRGHRNVMHRAAAVRIVTCIRALAGWVVLTAFAAPVIAGD